MNLASSAGPAGVASALLLDKHEFIVSCQLCLGKISCKEGRWIFEQGNTNWNHGNISNSFIIAYSS